MVHMLTLGLSLLSFYWFAAKFDWSMPSHATGFISLPDFARYFHTHCHANALYMARGNVNLSNHITKYLQTHCHTSALYMARGNASFQITHTWPCGRPSKILLSVSKVEPRQKNCKTATLKSRLFCKQPLKTLLLHLGMWPGWASQEDLRIKTTSKESAST